MTAPLTLIRNRVRDRLQDEAGLPNVHRTRWVPHVDGDIRKALVTCVYTITESADDQQTTPREYKRTCQLVIELLDTPRGISADEVYDGQGEARLDDLMDERLERIILAFETDLTLRGQGEGPLAADITYEGFEDASADTGKLLIVARRIRFSVTYYTDGGEPILDNFALGNVDWNMAEPKDEREEMGPDGPVDAQDNLTMEPTP